MNFTQQPQVILDCRHHLGESILWDERNQQLWWANIHRGEVWRWSPWQPQPPRVYPLASRVGAIGLRESSGIVLALEKGFALLDEITGEVSPLMAVESDLATTRLNDGRVDPAGRFVCGGMDEATPQKNISSVWSLDAEGQLVRRLPGVACANSLCWSPDGGTLYFTNMPTGRIEAYDYDVVSGEIGAARLFADLAGQPGLADGSVVDEQGFLWNAQWGGARIVRYAPDGRVDRVIPVPVDNPTCLTFGGPDRDILFITSAWFGLDPRDYMRQPLAGSLFALKAGVRGQREYRFKG